MYITKGELPMVEYDEVDKVYGVPKEEISCPSCGFKYGHHRTKVDKNSEECSKCAIEKYGKDKVDLISAAVFIQEILGYNPL